MFTIFVYHSHSYPIHRKEVGGLLLLTYVFSFIKFRNSLGHPSRWAHIISMYLTVIRTSTTFVINLDLSLFSLSYLIRLTFTGSVRQFRKSELEFVPNWFTLGGH